MSQRFTKKRRDELDQLVNDIAEDMNMKRWKRNDLIDCINYLADNLCENTQIFASTRSRVIVKMTEALKELTT